MCDFEEGQLDFPPTYKFDKGTDNYDSRWVPTDHRLPLYTHYIVLGYVGVKNSDRSCTKDAFILAEN